MPRLFPLRPIAPPPGNFQVGISLPAAPPVAASSVGSGTPALTLCFGFASDVPPDTGGEYTIELQAEPVLEDTFTTEPGGTSDFTARAVVSVYGSAAVPSAWRVDFLPGVGGGVARARIDVGYNTLVLLFDPGLDASFQAGVYEIYATVAGTEIGPVTFEVIEGV